MAASSETHGRDLEVEIVLGSYEQILFGYSLSLSTDSANLSLSFTDKSHCASVRALAASHRKLLASGSADETIQLFDLKSRQEAGTLMRHNATITHLEFYKEFLISSDENGVICVWKIIGKTYECLKALSGHKGSVTSFSVHPSGKLLLSVGHDKTIRTWNLVTGKRAYTTSTPSVIDIVKWSPDGERYVFLYGSKLDVCLLSKAAPVHSIKLPGKGHTLTFLSDKILAAGCETGVVSFINIDTATIVHEIVLDANRIKCVSSKLIENLESLLALVTNDGRVELHLSKIDGDDVVTTSLISACKTLLRPICMELIVTSDEPMKSDMAAEETAAVELKGQSEYKSLGRESGRAVQDEAEQTSEHQQSQGRKRRRKKQRSAADIKQTAAEKEVDTTSTQPDTEPASRVSERKRKFPIQRGMDSIKRFISSKKQAKSDSAASPKKSKKHMKPVDSVKITKQKMAERKKQNMARHVEPKYTEQSVIEEETSASS